MRIKCFFLGVFFLSPLILMSEIKNGGYFSFEFHHGQAQSASNQGSFKNLQGGLILYGDMAPEFDFIFELRLRTESTLEMEQTLINWKLGRIGDLKLGLFLVPFGKYNEFNRPHQTVLIQPPLNLEGFAPASWRDIGLCLRGKQGGVNYAAYIGNGLGEKDGAVAGQQFKDANKNKGIGGRVGLIIGEGFEAGLSYSTGKYDRENTLRLKLMGADLTWVTTDYEIRGEYTKALWTNPSEFPQGKADGFFVLLGLNFGALQPVASYQRWAPGNASQGLPLQILDREGEGVGERSRWAFGVRYSFNPSIIVKVEYDLNKEKNLVLKNNLFQAQAVLSF